MRIAFLTERMILGFGVDLVVDTVAQGLAKLGHDVTVFAINIDDSYKNRDYRLKRFICPLIWNPINQEIAAYQALNYIKSLETEFDVFVIETFPFFQYAAFLNKPVVIVEYGVPSTIGMDWKTKIRLNYEQITKNYVYYRYADKIIPISNYLKNNLPGFAKSKAEIVYCGADHYKQEVAKEKIDAFRKKLGVGKDEKLLLYVGRLNHKAQPYKGVRNLVKIYESVRQKDKKIHLLMVGYGTEEDKRELEKTPGIKVIVKAPHALMPVIYSSCDICVSASVWEGFNLPIAEANSFGKPSVCFDIGPHQEVISQDTSGFAVATNEEFAEKVLALASNKALYGRMAEGAIKKSEGFTWKNIIKQYDEIIRKTVTTSPKQIELGYKEDFVDIITVNYNGKRYLSNLFNSLNSQSYKKYEITMVDNGSHDGSVDFVRKNFNKIRTIPLDKNYFFAKANNIAIEQTKGEYILLLNNDTTIDKTALEEMLKTMKSDPQIAAVAPKMMFSKNRKVFDSFGVCITPECAPFNRGIGQYDIGQYDVEEDVFGACFGAVLIKRVFYEKVVGPLDNDYFGYFEDVDWCYRARGIGLRIVTCPKAIIYHDHSGTSKSMGYEWKYYLIHRNLLRTLFKNYKMKNLLKYYAKESFRLVKHGVKSGFSSRTLSCIRVLFNSLFYMPIIIAKRIKVMGKRVRFIPDEQIWAYAKGEKPFFDAELYEPEYTLLNIRHSYEQKIMHALSLNLSKNEVESVRQTLKLIDKILSQNGDNPSVNTDTQQLLTYLEKDIGQTAAKKFVHPVNSDVINL